jgi:hypothetical protein
MIQLFRNTISTSLLRWYQAAGLSWQGCACFLTSNPRADRYPVYQPIRSVSFTMGGFYHGRGLLASLVRVHDIDSGDPS